VAYEFYVRVKGQKQGDFKNETPREKRQGKIPGLAFAYEVSSPRDAATGQASGKRTHQPVTFVKAWGASSPQFFQALTTNELLPSVLFEFVATDPNGEEYVRDTVKLTNATVSRLRRWLDRPDQPASPWPYVRPLEEISFTFQRIELESKDGKTMAVDDWFQKG
jgi:type VI secretion system secreted protein Hcp